MCDMRVIARRTLREFVEATSGHQDQPAVKAALGLVRRGQEGTMAKHGGGKAVLRDSEHRGGRSHPVHGARPPPPMRTTSKRSTRFTEGRVLEYPQSGERIRGQRNIQSSRTAQPNLKRFTVRRIVGTGDLWVTEYILTYDGQPSYTVSIMEFLDGKVVRETQYFGDPFEPEPSRAQWGERIP
jgi:hypothetical protein